MGRKTIRDIDPRGKRVFVRVDYNVPLKDGVVTNDKRIRATIPTVSDLVSRGARVILASHLGRPDGERKPEFSLAPVAQKASEVLGRDVKFVDDCIGEKVEAAVNALKDGEILLLENARFYPEEEGKPKLPKDVAEDVKKAAKAEMKATQKEFVKKLARLCDIYVNDAFGTAHRAHATTALLGEVVKPAVSGYLMEAELKYLGEALNKPKRPFVAVLGGAKVSDKILLISHLLTQVEHILIGGAMAYTLLKAQGVRVGKSRVEEDQVEAMKALLATAGGKILLPVDHVAVDTFDFEAMAGGASVITADANIEDGLMGMDIGPKSIVAFRKVIESAGTIVWNGPMGVFEAVDYAAGTKAVAEATAAATDKGAVSVIGGGDSASAVEKMGLAKRMTHVSTGGGASIEFLEGKALPGVAALDEA
jgi:phosphoglycerate kinase